MYIILRCFENRAPGLCFTDVFLVINRKVIRPMLIGKVTLYEMYKNV